MRFFIIIKEYYTNVFNNIMSMQNLNPHGFCLFWQPDLMALTIIGNVAIWLAYMWIAIQLLVVFISAKKVKGKIIIEGKFWLALMFSSFIFLCGLTHAFEILVLYYPYYYAQALLDIITGIVSLTTASLMQFATYIEPHIETKE